MIWVWLTIVILLCGTLLGAALVIAGLYAVCCELVADLTGSHDQEAA